MATKTQLKNAINTLNYRINSGLNEDDILKKCCELDLKCKGFSFMPKSDYVICTDYEKLQWAVNIFGYFLKQIEELNIRLILKGGDTYKSELNNRILAELKQTV